MPLIVTPKWQREQVVDHKFDYVDIDELCGKDSLYRRIKYIGLYMMTFRSFMMYVADLASVAFQFLVSAGQSSGGVLDHGLPVIADYVKYVYLFCLLVSCALLIVDARKARKIVKSRDISFTFTHSMAYRYYAFRSYPHFGFFEEINNMKRYKDNMALFVFLLLRGWKRLLFAETPRAAINVYFLVLAYVNDLLVLNWSDFNTFLIVLIAMSVLIYSLNAASHLLAILIYIPLIFEIRGNLKEYCCHKIDKRIAQLIAKGSERKAIQLQIANHRLHAGTGGGAFRADKLSQQESVELQSVYSGGAESVSTASQGTYMREPQLPNLAMLESRSDPGSEYLQRDVARNGEGRNVRSNTVQSDMPPPTALSSSRQQGRQQNTSSNIRETRNQLDIPRPSQTQNPRRYEQQQARYQQQQLNQSNQNPQGPNDQRRAYTQDPSRPYGGGRDSRYDVVGSRNRYANNYNNR